MEEQPARQRLIDALIRKQGARSDRQFAAELGVSASLWNRVKRGQFRISDRMIDAITSHCADLKPELDFFLRERATIRNTERANMQRQEVQP